jgi:hypothetical protein
MITAAGGRECCRRSSDLTAVGPGSGVSVSSMIKIERPSFL